jgi:pimeloyl-ACP methyl ester carboxylesterase
MIPGRVVQAARRSLLATAAAVLLASCAVNSPHPYHTDFDLLAELPDRLGSIEDDRGRFREILCAVIERHGEDLPDYRPCEEALTRVGLEPPGTGEPVDFSNPDEKLLVGFVPGLGWDCVVGWLDVENFTSPQSFGYGFHGCRIQVDGLSGTRNNASQIAEQLGVLVAEHASKKLVLIGYSKGTSDILRFLVDYPGLADNVVAVVSIAGAVGGSPLSYDAKQNQAELLKLTPQSECDDGDGKAVESLRPDRRLAWLEENELPGHVAYYSVVTFPEPDRISRGLRYTWRKLSAIDSRNDAQLLFYDQVIPGSTVIALPNADHWAMAVPVKRSHKFIGATFVNKNDYPREAFLEAVVRYVEEALSPL